MEMHALVLAREFLGWAAAAEFVVGHCTVTVSCRPSPTQPQLGPGGRARTPGRSGRVPLLSRAAQNQTQAAPVMTHRPSVRSTLTQQECRPRPRIRSWLFHSSAHGAPVASACVLYWTPPHAQFPDIAAAHAALVCTKYCILLTPHYG